MGTATGGGLWLTELPGLFVDRGGGAGLAFAERGGLSLSFTLPGRRGDALGGGVLVRRGVGEARATRVAGADMGGLLLLLGVRARSRGGTGGGASEEGVGE